MNDKNIRSALIAHVRSADHATAVFEELPLCRGIGRADVAAVNGALWGYEIKGSRDSVRRLPKQVDDYNHIFDYCVVAVAPNHLNAVREIIPSCWGIMLAHETDTGLAIRPIRKPRHNRSVDPQALIRLMWRREAFRALRNHGIILDQRTIISVVWDVMAAKLSRRAIADEVRAALKARAGF